VHPSSDPHTSTSSLHSHRQLCPFVVSAVVVQSALSVGPCHAPFRPFTSHRPVAVGGAVCHCAGWQDSSRPPPGGRIVCAFKWFFIILPLTQFISGAHISYAYHWGSSTTLPLPPPLSPLSTFSLALSCVWPFL